MTWQLFEKDSPILIQGMTGREGSRMADWLIKSGVRVVAGVTPGKGGQTVQGQPIFHSVKEARERFPQVIISCVVVPPLMVRGAVEEAIRAGIKFIYILSEHVPVYDVILFKRLAEEHGATILGPSSVGYLQFPQFRIGYLGGQDPFVALKEGTVAIVSTSGGMTNELMMMLQRIGVGIKCAFALGGDRVIGFGLEDALRWVESLPEVKQILVFCEPGRPWLQAVASGSFVFQKPGVIFLAGESLETLPRGLPYGHTGTILGEQDRSVEELRSAISARGISCVNSMKALETYFLSL